LSVARFRLRRRVALANAREGKATKPLNFLNLSHHIGNGLLNTFSSLAGLIAKFDGLSLPSGSAGRDLRHAAGATLQTDSDLHRWIAPRIQDFPCIKLFDSRHKTTSSK